MLNYSYSCFTFFPNYTLFCVNNTLRKASEFSAIFKIYNGHVRAVPPWMDLEVLPMKPHNVVNTTFYNQL